MIEVNILRRTDPEVVASALPRVLGAEPPKVLPVERYWDLTKFDDFVGYDLIPDDPWSLLTLHSVNPMIVEDALSIARKLSDALGTACAVADPKNGTAGPDGVVLFSPNEDARAALISQVAGRFTILVRGREYPESA